MKEARIFLANETLRQIKEGKLNEYLNSKKLKDKERFKKYIDIFIEELEKGYLRKRLPKDKVLLLIRAWLSLFLSSYCQSFRQILSYTIISRIEIYFRRNF